jgi:1-deoxy-D-xylulose-5-phosphate synthase
VLLDAVSTPQDLRRFTYPQLEELASEVREFIVAAVSENSGHLGSNLGVVELTFALHRVFDSPNDLLLWDTGHQAYVHKIVTGRKADFAALRQPGGMSGYPNRRESDHDWIENSHASTVLSYAHGLAEALKAKGDRSRRVVAVIGDGSMTGGMAYEALNNLGQTKARVLIVLNDNGRSYAPTISGLTRTVTRIRTKPSYARGKKKSETIIENLPIVGPISRRTVKGVKSALREVIDEPVAFFENLGVRYIGPIDGHDLPMLETTLRNAAEFDGPIVVHCLTQKGKGYRFAEDDEEKNLHDVPAGFDAKTGTVKASASTWTNEFTTALLGIARERSDLHAITAAMPGPTGLLPFQAEFPNRFHDVGIAEQHAVTLAAGMALGGLKPIVALYSTFFTRAFDQANLDVGLHRLPVTFVLDRAGITGEDGASHHGVLDMVLCSKIPGMTVFAPSSAQELAVQLRSAIAITDGPTCVRFARGAARQVGPDAVGSGLSARRVLNGGDHARVCLIAVGRLLEAAEGAASLLRAEHGVEVTVWDPRVVVPLDADMIADAARHDVVITIEDGMAEGGIGSAIAIAISSHRVGHNASAGPVVVLGTPRRYLAHGKPTQILSELGLDVTGIVSAITTTLAATPVDSRPSPTR